MLREIMILVAGICALTAIPCAAANQFVLDPPVVVAPGLAVPIVIDNEVAVVGFQFTVEFHSDCLRFASAVAGSDLPPSVSIVFNESTSGSFAHAPDVDRRVTVVVVIVDPSQALSPGTRRQVATLRFVTTDGPTPTVCKVCWDERPGPPGSPQPCSMLTSAGTQIGPESIVFSACRIVGPTPPQVIRNLVEAVQDLRAIGALNQGGEASLTAKLEAALNSLNGGNTAAACNQIHSFINQVNAMISGGTLSAADGQRLLDAARELVATLGC